MSHEAMKHVSGWRVVALIVTMVAMPGIARAETDPASDIAMKAAFLYNFAKFTDWPSLAPAASLTLCVVGALVQTVRSQRITGHPLEVKAISSDAPIRSCDVVFISPSEMRRGAAVLDNLQAQPILTVSEAKGFARSSGIIELFVEDGRMRFAINTDAADRAGLRLSSRLLGLARIVRDDHVQ